MGVAIEDNDGRYKPGAKVTLRNPEVLDEWPVSRQTAYVKNKEVSVCVGNSEGWLCVAKLPPTHSEEQFVKLAGNFGKIREAFLMISETSGRSDVKGIGVPSTDIQPNNTYVLYMLSRKKRICCVNLLNLLPPLLPFFIVRASLRFSYLSIAVPFFFLLIQKSL